MLSTMVLLRQAEVLEHVCGYHTGLPNDTDRSEHTPTRELTITIARQPGTPASEIARAVGARLGWSVHDRDLLQRLADRLHVPIRAVEALDEQPQSWLLECLHMLSGSSTCVSEARYVSQLRQLIHEVAAAGRCIIVGRGAAHMLPPRHTLRVRLVGQPEDRIAAIRRHCRLDWPTAAKRTRETEQAWGQFVAQNFAKDSSSAHEFHLVLNTSHWSVAECTDLIVDAVRSRRT